MCFGGSWRRLHHTAFVTTFGTPVISAISPHLPVAPVTSASHKSTGNALARDVRCFRTTASMSKAGGPASESMEESSSE